MLRGQLQQGNNEVPPIYEENGGSLMARIALSTLFGGIIIYGLWYWNHQTTYHKRPAYLMSEKHKLRDAVEKRYSILINEVNGMLGDLRSEEAIPDIDEYGTDRREWKKAEAVRLKSLKPALQIMKQRALDLIEKGGTPVIPEGKDIGVEFTPYTRTREPYNVAIPQYMLGAGG